MLQENCCTCKFSYKIENAFVLVCRRYPPVFVGGKSAGKLMVGFGSVEIPNQPQVEDVNYCGEWQEDKSDDKP